MSDQYIIPYQMPVGKERDDILAMIIQSYFKQYGYPMPDDVANFETLKEEWDLIMYSEKPDEILKALKAFKDHAEKIHSQYAQRIKLNKISALTIKKFMRLTTMDDFLNDMGVDNGTYANLESNFVTKNVLDEIIKQLDNPKRPDVINAFSTKGKCQYIASKLKELI